MLQTTTLKRNLVPRFGEPRKKDGFQISVFRQLVGLPPLKETFVGSLESLTSSRGPQEFYESLLGQLNQLFESSFVIFNPQIQYVPALHNDMMIHLYLDDTLGSLYHKLNFQLLGVSSNNFGYWMIALCIYLKTKMRGIPTMAFKR